MTDLGRRLDRLDGGGKTSPVLLIVRSEDEYRAAVKLAASQGLPPPLIIWRRTRNLGARPVRNAP
jgi:hypothetical protein